MNTTTAKQLRAFPRTLKELLNHPGFRNFGDTSDDWINDPERMKRCHDAAENGEDGSTYFERLQDMRDNLQSMRDDMPYSLNDRTLAILDSRVEAITAEIDACEAWHEENGSLHTSR